MEGCSFSKMFRTPPFIWNTSLHMFPLLLAMRVSAERARRWIQWKHILRMKTICRKDGKDGTDAMIGKDTMSFVHVHFGWVSQQLWNEISGHSVSASPAVQAVPPTLVTNTVCPEPSATRKVPAGTAKSPTQPRLPTYSTCHLSVSGFFKKTREGWNRFCMKRILLLKLGNHH